nr:hypothetical protein Iba_chr02bCG2920 [Ipomoea batatas]
MRLDERIATVAHSLVPVWPSLLHGKGTVGRMKNSENNFWNLVPICLLILDLVKARRSLMSLERRDAKIVCVKDLARQSKFCKITGSGESVGRKLDWKGEQLIQTRSSEKLSLSKYRPCSAKNRWNLTTEGLRIEVKGGYVVEASLAGGKCSLWIASIRSVKGVTPKLMKEKPRWRVALDLDAERFEGKQERAAKKVYVTGEFWKLLLEEGSGIDVGNLSEIVSRITVNASSWKKWKVPHACGRAGFLQLLLGFVRRHRAEGCLAEHLELQNEDCFGLLMMKDAGDVSGERTGAVTYVRSCNVISAEALYRARERGSGKYLGQAAHKALEDHWMGKVLLGMFFVAEDKMQQIIPKQQCLCPRQPYHVIDDGVASFTRKTQEIIKVLKCRFAERMQRWSRMRVKISAKCIIKQWGRSEKNFGGGL